MQAQDEVMADFNAHPKDYTKTLFILDEAAGKEAFAVPHFSVQTMNGATTPPCVDRDGKLIIPVMFVRSGWGRLDLASRRITDILFDNKNLDGNPLKENETPAGMGNRDENLNVTCTGNAILAMHTMEGNANYTGAFDLDARRWIKINSGYTNLEMSTNTQGGGGNPASISYGVIFHISFHELIARVTEP
jgi:hypothetical protein